MPTLSRIVGDAPLELVLRDRSFRWIRPASKLPTDTVLLHLDEQGYLWVVVATQQLKMAGKAAIATKYEDIPARALAQSATAYKGVFLYVPPPTLN